MVEEPRGRVGKGQVCGFEYVGDILWVDHVHLCEIVPMNGCGSLCAYCGHSILIAKVSV